MIKFLGYSILIMLQVVVQPPPVCNPFEFHLGLHKAEWFEDRDCSLKGFLSLVGESI
jgi:hypothetical protein